MHLITCSIGSAFGAQEGSLGHGRTAKAVEDDERDRARIKDTFVDKEKKLVDGGTMHRHTRLLLQVVLLSFRPIVVVY
jgi:hypothetical protein